MTLLPNGNTYLKLTYLNYMIILSQSAVGDGGLHYQLATANTTSSLCIAPKQSLSVARPWRHIHPGVQLYEASRRCCVQWCVWTPIIWIC